jgi:hypothetical protein
MGMERHCEEGGSLEKKPTKRRKKRQGEAKRRKAWLGQWEDRRGATKVYGR